MADSTRLHRLIEILNMIDKGKTVTPKGLADHFGVHERTIYRDVNDLRIDFPIEFNEETNSYRFLDGFSLKKLDLSSKEVKLLLAGRAALSKMGEGLSSTFTEMVSKIRAETGKKTEQRLKITRNQFWFDIDPVTNYSEIKSQFEIIQEAMDDNNSVNIRYKGMGDQKETKRMLDPYGLFYSSGVWYTIGYCHLRKDIRIFALDCIKDIRKSEDYYSIPSDFSMDRYFEAGWHIVKYGKPVDIQLKFTKAVARWITRRKWHPTQKIEKMNDGSITVTVTLNGSEEIRRWVYHWGPNCEVLSPTEFRREVIEELSSMSKVYEQVHL